MTEPSESIPSPEPGQPQLDPELIQDLDAADDDGDIVRGGACPKSRPV
jgi:hypothetical protein